MANLSEKNILLVKIPKVEIIDKVTHYIIVIQLSQYIWEVYHRYSEFVELHDNLVTDHGLARDLLPPKKILGNKDPAFIENRRNCLEEYLQKIVTFLSTAIPERLAEFLELKHFEINFLLRDLAKGFFKSADALLQKNDFVEFNPLQLMAISMQMRSLHQSVLMCDRESDFTNVIDFCSNVKRVVVKGSSEKHRSSNVIMNELEYSFNAFKRLEELKILNASASRIEDFGVSRKSLKLLTVKRCGLTQLSHILSNSFRDNGASSIPEDSWSELRHLDLSLNSIDTLDVSFQLTQNLTYLNLSGNRLTSIGKYLTKLPNLTHLNLSNNQLNELEDLHIKFGNIVELDLSQNNLSALSGLSKLYCVVSLNLASNFIKNVIDVKSICNLPCLDDLNLSGNPVTTSIDYRTKTLELFDKRASEVCLDNERPTQKELDKVAVFQALRTAREGKLPVMSLSHPQPSSPLSLGIEKLDVASIAKE